MASFLLSECLENIFLNFIKYPSSDDRIKILAKDLRSCTLVSRYWCRISTPLLYAYPFNNKFEDLLRYFKLIRTLLNCIPISEINQIFMSYALESSTKYIPSTFNYVSFIRGFIFNESILQSKNLRWYRNTWLPVHNLSSEQIIGIMNLILNFIFKRSNNLSMLEIPHTMGYVSKSSQFISIIPLPLQNKLQHVILSEGTTNSLWESSNYGTVFNLLSTQNESLHVLEFKNLSFYKIDEKSLNLLCLLKKIRVLKLHYCKGVNNLSPWAKGLTKLKVLEIAGYPIPEDFLTQLSSNTLTKLVMNHNLRSQNFIQIFQQIPLCLHSLSHLELPKILPTELISIFKSCINLVYLSVILDDDENLMGLGKFVPKTLERIKFRLMKRNDSKRSSRCLLEDYVNNKGALKYLEFRYGYLGVQSVMSITKQFGVQIN